MVTPMLYERITKYNPGKQYDEVVNGHLYCIGIIDIGVREK